MNIQDFEFIRTLVKERSGLVLTADKGYLLESRLMPLTRQRKMENISALVAAARKGDPALIQEVVEAMTTNESLFFRDIKPFDLLRDVMLPKIMAQRINQKRIRIWCTASSSGQEPYSIAMTLKEMATKLAGWRVEILATDIATSILDKAKKGLYSQFEVQRGMPFQLMMKYFQKVEDMWQISQEIRSMVEFKRFNLLEPMRSLGTFDVVFCRNVLIYFDEPTKRKVLDEISKLLPEDGVLFLGGAETIIGITDKFQLIPGCRGIYALNGQTAQRPRPAQSVEPAVFAAAAR